MGIPRKGSRAVTYKDPVRGERSFRYLVKETHVVGHPDQKELSITVQEDVEKPGNVLQCRWPHGHAVTNYDVSGLINEALKRGWDPNRRGAAFVLPA